MSVRFKALAAPLAKFAGAGAAAIVLSACATNAGKGNVLGGDADYKDAVGVFANGEADPDGLDPIAAAAFWGTRYEREPKSPETAVQYSNALRKIGSLNEAVTVMTKSASQNPDNPAINLELGKALVEDGRAFEAVRYLETALAETPHDWRALSAYGVALDQIGEHEGARAKYDEALRYSPDAVSVMSNKGLSYALSGDLDQAVATLRAATTGRRGNARIRQNLALALAIKGDMGEAVRLARSDLPPPVADNNIDYYRKLTAQPSYWADYAADDIDVPAFDDAPAAPLAPSKSAPTPLKEETKPEKKDKNAPVALVEPATPVTNASAMSADSEESSAPDLKKN